MTDTIRYHVLDAIIASAFKGHMSIAEAERCIWSLQIPLNQKRNSIQLLYSFILANAS